MSPAAAHDPERPPLLLIPAQEKTTCHTKGGQSSQSELTVKAHGQGSSPTATILLMHASACKQPAGA